MRLQHPLFFAALAMLSLSPRLNAQVTEPVEALARKLKTEPAARAEAGKTVEALLLRSEPSFVGADADHAALGALARAWAADGAPAQVAALAYAASNPATAPGLRAALTPWTGKSRIGRGGEKAAAGAFLSDASAKAAALLEDPRTSTPAREAVERERKLGERNAARDWGALWKADSLHNVGRAVAGTPGLKSALAATNKTGTVLYRGVTGVVPAPPDDLGKQPIPGGLLLREFESSFGDAFLNPLMFLAPSMSRLASKVSSVSPASPAAPAAKPTLDILNSLSNVGVTQVNPEVHPGGGAFISVSYVGASERKQSAQDYLSGVAAFQSGDPGKARGLWESALKLDPGNADAKAGLEKLAKTGAPVK